jgi:hypothetical protein
MLAPPSELGGVKVSVACPLPATTVVSVGAPGAVATGVDPLGVDRLALSVPPPPQLPRSTTVITTANFGVIYVFAGFDFEIIPF